MAASTLSTVAVITMLVVSCFCGANGASVTGGRRGGLEAEARESLSDSQIAAKCSSIGPSALAAAGDGEFLVDVQAVDNGDACPSSYHKHPVNMKFGAGDGADGKQGHRIFLCLKWGPGGSGELVHDIKPGAQSMLSSWEKCPSHDFKPVVNAKSKKPQEFNHVTSMFFGSKKLAVCMKKSLSPKTAIVAVYFESGVCQCSAEEWQGGRISMMEWSEGKPWCRSNNAPKNFESTLTNFNQGASSTVSGRSNTLTMWVKKQDYVKSDHPQE